MEETAHALETAHSFPLSNSHELGICCSYKCFHQLLLNREYTAKYYRRETAHNKETTSKTYAKGFLFISLR